MDPSPMVTEDHTFWNTKSLQEMTPGEWESLCDGCGRCCLHKLEDIDSSLLFYTNVACRLLDEDSCRCTNYPQRMSLVSDCMQLSPDRQEQFAWLPTSCAYRRLANGQGLEDWHPLLSGDPESVRRAGISVYRKTVSEEGVRTEELEEHIITWIEL